MIKSPIEDQIVLMSPVVTQEKFAETSGLRKEQVRGQVSGGNLPTYKVGRLRMINLVALADQCRKANQ